MSKKRILIMGAAGRDFHNFNTYFRNNQDYEVVAFTATQIPDIAGRKYPAALAGKLYPKGIPIYDEKELTKLITKLKVDQVVFAYSDVPYAYVMGKGAVVNAAGADFMMLGPKDTMIKSTKPVISICAVRTGSGKSQTTRRVIEILMAMGKKVVAIRHPMPYGDLVKQKVQRFATVQDLAKHKCTIEEMEEYEPHVVRGNVIYAGVDYEAILRQAEKEADVIVWDGGNNDFSFYKSDLEIVVVDPHRPGHELSYYPGEVNLRRADVIVINKEDSARKEDIKIVKANIKTANPRALVIDADSPVTVEQPQSLKGKRVLVIEDGPTLTHGEMKYGAGVVAAKKHGVAKMIDPRPYAVGTIADTFKKYPGIGVLLPAMGYSAKQISDLQATINRTPCDMYVVGTPIDLRRLVKFPKPAVRVGYDLKETSHPDLAAAIKKVIKK
ncbi:MAG: cyclic 2,3-diphosphoglycerate synthase [Candidatus Edwardsbacteria bacterium]|nr:cyclic 2,3-diphosphoglycerate synthase [Candidatus Edwardsbacteria bacterium]